MVSALVLVPLGDLFTTGYGRILLLGYPAQNIWIRLTISRGDRIMTETLADPGHLITRTYTYPEK